VSRRLGRAITHLAAVLTLGRMPPFASVSSLVVRDGSLLVVLDPIRHEPVLPGGHLKWRESPEAGIQREVREETGYEITNLSLLGVFSGEEWTSEPGVVRLIYSGAISSGRLTSSAEGEAMWVPVKEFEESSVRDSAVLRAYGEAKTAVSD
jgi:8-oxo-dGTP diphosphatase